MSAVHEQVKHHFEKEASCYGTTITKLIPWYHEMISAVADALPFQRNQPFHLIDLGCGAGTVSAMILERFPQCRVTALDFSGAMIREAGKHLNDERIRFVQADFSTWTWDRSYDAIVSSLALHHLITDEHKKLFYRRCFQQLEPGGIFCNADIVLASRSSLQAVYMKRWKTFMMRSVSEREIEEEWLVKYRNEDVPGKMQDHLRWMSEIGYVDFDIVWKYYNFAVYCAFKS